LARRLPKLPGFKNINRTEYLPVNVDRLETHFADGDVVDSTSLAAKAIIKNSTLPVKVLGGGNLSKSLTVRVDKVSARAAEKIAQAGGKVEPPC
jgi:large subunit ribosomal protein L15